MSTVRITIAHARAARLDGRGQACAPGIRAWCGRYGVDVRRFLREGMSLEDAQRIDDAFARRVVQLALQEAAACE
ncbi:MAG: hypothetical protein J0L89_08075 [Xanthomonadales bacterium]|nr:hypothetical protein [Xanthomonadales bacterium]MBN8261165.1 hypothetical protein [Xanthomonadales bacterium]